MEGTTDRVEKRTAIQGVLDRLKKWAYRNTVHRYKCQVLHLRKKTPWKQCHLARVRPGSSSAKRAWGTSLGSLSMNQERVLAAMMANCILGEMNRSIENRWGKVSLLLSTHIWNTASSFESSSIKNILNKWVKFRRDSLWWRGWSTCPVRKSQYFQPPFPKLFSELTPKLQAYILWMLNCSWS